MGYRSDVAIIVYPPRNSTSGPNAVTAFQAYLAMCIPPDMTGSLASYWKHNIQVGVLPRRHGALALMLMVNGYKWYDEFPEVRGTMDALTMADTMGLEYEFLRIGEEDGDMERLESDNADLGMFYVSREIVAPYPLEPVDTVELA